MRDSFMAHYMESSQQMHAARNKCPLQSCKAVGCLIMRLLEQKNTDSICPSLLFKYEIKTSPCSLEPKDSAVVFLK